MNKKFKGFSLAELLVSLLIISIVLSAAIPTITRRAASKSKEAIWSWTKTNGAYFGVGESQNAILGYDGVPLKETPLSSLISATQSANDANESLAEIPAFDITGRAHIGDMNAVNIDDKFDNALDKFVILKRNTITSNSNFVSSHIGFYTLEGGASTEDNIRYVGRLTMDYGNLALGMASLQGLAKGNLGENTALGHFTLSKNIDGIRNTAVGRKSLSFNLDGSYNTALGFGSLYELGGSGNTHTTTQTADGGKPDENTAIGAMSQEYVETGKYNTSIGSQSLRRNRTSIGNTAVGRLSLYGLLSGKDNVAIGHRSCEALMYGSHNICIGGFEVPTAGTADDPSDYGLYIGATSSQSKVPLITGSTLHKLGTQDKKLSVNAKIVEFRPFNGSTPLFQFMSSSGSNGISYDSNYGYSDTPDGYYGSAMFLLRDLGTKEFYKPGAASPIQAASTALYFRSRKDLLIDEKNKAVYIDAFDPYNTTSPYNLADVSFNGMLTFDFAPYKSIKTITSDNKVSAYNNAGMDGKVRLAAQNVENNKMYNLILNNTLELSDLATTIYTYKGTDVANPKKLLIVNNSLSSDISELYFKADRFRLINSEVASDTKLTLDMNLASGVYNMETKGNGFIGFLKSASSSGSPAYKMYIKAENSDQDIYIEKLNTTAGATYGKDGSVVHAILNLYSKLDGTSSDARLKNISGNNTAGLKEINALEVKNYTYKSDKEKTPHVGVIAQQLQKIFPNAVFKGDDGYLKIRTEDIFYAMVNSIKELCAKIQDLTIKITGLDKRITELEKQNQLLIKQNKEFEKRLEKLESQAAKK